MKIRKCKDGDYTLKEKCHQKPTVSPHPPPFSMEREKKWGKYRRMAKAKNL